jgi:hypothetical protein
MRSSPGIGRLILAAVAWTSAFSAVFGQEPHGVAAAGGNGLQPKIVSRETAEGPRTYGTTTTSALTLSASVFVPNDSSTNWTFSLVNGGQYITSGHPFLGHGINLPEGVLVTKIELDGCDNDNAGSIRMWVAKCSVGGPCIDVESIGTQTVDTPGCGRFPLTLATPFTIDNLNNSYYAYVSTSGGSNASFFAVRIYYQLQLSPAPLTATFSDVSTSHPYFRAIEALAASGITTGCGGGNFCPDQNVTRGEIAKFLANALGLHHAP